MLQKLVLVELYYYIGAPKKELIGFGGANLASCYLRLIDFRTVESIYIAEPLLSVARKVMVGRYSVVVPPCNQSFQPLQIMREKETEATEVHIGSTRRLASVMQRICIGMIDILLTVEWTGKRPA